MSLGKVEREMIAGYFRLVADAIENDQLLAVHLKWDGGLNVENTSTLNGTLDYVTINCTVDAEPKVKP